MERWNDVMEDVGNPTGIVLFFIFPRTENFDYENITIVCVCVSSKELSRVVRAILSGTGHYKMHPAGLQKSNNHNISLGC